jgi:hypothetical protein
MWQSLYLYVPALNQIFIEALQPLQHDRYVSAQDVVASLPYVPAFNQIALTGNFYPLGWPV